jgi:hypothetical protein
MNQLYNIKQTDYIVEYFEQLAHQILLYNSLTLLTMMSTSSLDFWVGSRRIDD